MSGGLVDVPPVDANRPRKSMGEYFKEDQLVVRRGELLSLLEIYFRAHGVRYHRPFFQRMYLALRGFWGRPVDHFADKRMTPEEIESERPSDSPT